MILIIDERSPCGACIWQVAYNYDWKIYSCDEWRMLPVCEIITSKCEKYEKMPEKHIQIW